MTGGGQKSMIGALVFISSARTSSTAAVLNTRGATGPSMAASSWATTSRACSTVAMNGIRVRSKRTSGNWMSNALPMVSALMPVLSDRKKTRTATSRPEAGSAGCTGSGDGDRGSG